MSDGDSTAEAAAGETQSAAAGHAPASTLSVLGLFLLVTLAFSWGSSWPVHKLALAEIQPMGYRVMTTYAGAVLLLLLARWQGHPVRVPRSEIRPLIILAIINICAFQIMSTFGLRMIEAGRAAILAYTLPLWMVIIGWLFLGEKLTLSRFAALVMGLGAMALLIAPDIVKLGRAPLGTVLLTCCAITWATGTTYYKSRQWKLSAGALAGWQLMIGGIPIVIIYLIAEPALKPQDWSSTTVGAVFYVLAMATVYSHWCWFRILQLLPSWVASIGILGAPVVGVFSATVVLDEVLTWRELAALLLVVASMALVMIGPEGFRQMRRAAR